MKDDTILASQTFGYVDADKEIQAEELIKSREKRLSENFGYKTPSFEIGLLDMSGNMNKGKSNKAKVLFELNMGYYSENPIVFLS